MRKFCILLLVGACGVPTSNSVSRDAPTQASEQSIARFVSDVAFDKSAAEQAAIANCGAQNTTTEELQRLSAVDGPLDAATTGLISEIMTREGTLACMAGNGVSL